MLFLLTLMTSLATAEPLQVGVSDSPPFSMEVDGEWEGISVDLWEKIADDNGWEYEYVSTDLIGLLDGAESGELDASISSLTITGEREKVVDFTTSYYTETLGIATTRAPSAMESYLTSAKTIGYGIFWLLIAMFGMGTIYWYIEKGKTITADSRGWLNSCYWTLATMTTVGYGDEAPKSVLGRITAMVWMVISLLIFGSVMGMFSAAMNVPTSFSLNHPQELRSYDVATVDGSVSAKFLDKNRVRYTAENSVADLRADLLNPDTATDFIIYDRTILLYMLADDPIADVIDAQFDEQHFGFALPTGSPLTEELNVGILTHIGTEEWNQTVFSYTN